MGRVLPSGTVTLVFTDIEGSTVLLDAVGAAYGELLGEHRRLLRAAWASHGGVEVDTEGDAFFVAFTDANAAVAAACDAQCAVGEHGWAGGHRVRVRIGVHTGTPAIRDGRYWGSDVHYAARLAAAAHGGQILCSESTRALIREFEAESLGEHALKDFLVPREIFHVVTEGRHAREFPRPRTLETRRSNLPTPLTGLLGREAELADLTDRCMGDRRLLTLVGPGGSGKTRLAIELGHRVAASFDSTWFVALDEVGSSGEVMGAVARTLGLPERHGVSERDRVIDHLRDRRLLLVLDNAEHVIDAAPQVGSLAAAGDGVRIVVTSQTPLRVAAEEVVRVEPLALPSGEERELAALAAVPAVALLLERTRSAGTPLWLTEANAIDVVGLCRQLEGMPLAIELAAARLGILDVASLSSRLEQGIDSLGKGGRDLPARQRGLRAVLEWSCGLLEDGERELLADLSVFAASFTPELAEAAFGNVLDGLETLLEVGLLRRSESGRLILRPPVRRFAAELLRTHDRQTAANSAVARALVELGEPIEARGIVDEADGRRRFVPEAANVLAALNWTTDRDHLLHARLTAATCWSLYLSADARPARDHVARALERTTEPRMRARLLQAQGVLAFAAADPTSSLEAADAWHQLGEPAREVLSLVMAANLCTHAGDRARSVRCVERAGDVAAGVPDDELLQTLVQIESAGVAIEAGQIEEAEQQLRVASARAPRGSMLAYETVAYMTEIYVSTERYAEALEINQVGLRMLSSLAAPMLELLVIEAASYSCAMLGRVEDAATAFAVAELIRDELSWPPTPANEELNAILRARLDAELPAARHRAANLGIRGGIEWTTEIACRPSA